MNPNSTMVLIVLLVAGAMHGQYWPLAGATDPAPAVLFWEKALPGTPIPESITDLVSKGADHSALADYAAKYAAADPRVHVDGGGCTITLTYSYNCVGLAGPEALEAASGVFFHQEAVQVGTTMTVALPPATKKTPFLPRDVSNKIPFPVVSSDSHQLANVLAMFKIAPGSAEANEMSTTLRRCESPPLAGEQKACATSLEGVVDAAAHMLGGGGAMWAASSAVPAAGLPRREYSVEAVTPLAGINSPLVACHNIVYPYAVYQCHATAAGQSKAYMVTIRRAGGDNAAPTMAMAAVCHYDTSAWNPAHPAFQVLGTHPGGAPVCHFMPYADLLFGQKPPANA